MYKLLNLLLEAETSRLCMIGWWERIRNICATSVFRDDKSAQIYLYVSLNLSNTIMG